MKIIKLEGGNSYEIVFEKHAVYISFGYCLPRWGLGFAFEWKQFLEVKFLCFWFEIYRLF